MHITLVTGNPGKLKELLAMMPAGFEVEAQAIDLPEIQSLDLREIVKDKAKKAYAIVGSPVIIEDVSAGLDDLAGLPGPFYKFFHQELGDTILVKLSKIASSKVTIRCTAAYYDGKEILFGEGVIKGTVVEPRGENGFGFDPVIVPAGENRTLAQMRPEEKNAISHRSQAFRNLIAQLKVD